MKFFRKLNSHGVAHHFALVVIVLGTAIGGTAYLVANYADSQSIGAAYVNDVAGDCSAGVLNGIKKADLHIANCESQGSSVIATAGQQGQAGSYVAYAKKTTAQQAPTLNACIAAVGTSVYNDAKASTTAKPYTNASGVLKTVNECAVSLGGNADTAAKHPHVYEGHIESIASVNICKDIEVEAHDDGSIPYVNDNLTAYIELSGGPYKSTSILGPSVVNDNTISGNAATDRYHHWATPVAIQDYYGSTPITMTMVLKAKGVPVSFTAGSSAKSITVPASKDCGTAPKKQPTTTKGDGHGGKPITTPTKTENGPSKSQKTAGKTNAHQYEAHIVSTNYCSKTGNVEVEAHDYGANPTPGTHLKVEVRFANGAATVKGSKLKTLVGFADNRDVTDSLNNTTDSLADYMHWPTPADIESYSVDNFPANGATVETLTVYSVTSAGKATKVTASGVQTANLLPCAPSTQKDKQGQTQVQVATATCQKQLPGIAETATSFVNCVTLQEQGLIQQAVTSDEAAAVKALKITLPKATVTSIQAACNAKYVDSKAAPANLKQAIQNCVSSKETAQLDNLALTKIKKEEPKVQSKDKTIKHDSTQITSDKTKLDGPKGHPEQGLDGKQGLIATTQSKVDSLSSAVNSALSSGYASCSTSKIKGLSKSEYCHLVWDYPVGQSASAICDNIPVQTASYIKLTVNLKATMPFTSPAPYWSTLSQDLAQASSDAESAVQRSTTGSLSAIASAANARAKASNGSVTKVIDGNKIQLSYSFSAQVASSTAGVETTVFGNDHILAGSASSGAPYVLNASDVSTHIKNAVKSNTGDRQACEAQFATKASGDQTYQNDKSQLASAQSQLSSYQAQATQLKSQVSADKTERTKAYAYLAKHGPAIKRPINAYRWLKSSIHLF